MATLELRLDRKSSELIGDLAKLTGKTPERIVRDAIVKFAEGAEADEQRNFEKWKAALNDFEGMWEHRDDLPDFDAIRKSWDRNVWGDKQ